MRVPLKTFQSLKNFSCCFLICFSIGFLYLAIILLKEKTFLPNSISLRMHFKKLINKKSLFIENSITENSKENKNGQYFSFMNKAQLKETFDKVFL